MCVALDHMKSSCIVTFDARTKRNVELNNFSVVASYRLDMLVRKSITDKQRGVPLKRAFFQSSSIMEHI